MPETGGRPVPRGRGGYLRRRLALSSKYALRVHLSHWLMVIGFLFMWISGFIIGNVVGEDTLLESLLFYLHASFAVTFGALLVRRIGVGFTQGVPSLPAEIRPFERTRAHLADAALYALPAVIITLGWCSSSIGGHLVHWFGIEVPKIFPDAEEFDGFVEGLHMWIAYAMLAVALAHVAGAFKHRWIDGHDVIHRMTLTGKKKGETMNLQRE